MPTRAPIRLISSFVLVLAISVAQNPPATPPPVPQAPQPAPGAPPQQPAPANVTVPGGLNLTNASLLEVIDLLARDLHINYILDPKVQGRVTINTYGEIRAGDLKPILETILRMNGFAMVQVGNIYRIVPVADVSHLPISPQVDAKDLPDDERMILNLVFLKYVTSSEMSKILEPFMGESFKMVSYDPANLLILQDNSRNMRRTMELIALFDSDSLAGQRVRLFDVKNGRPTDVAKELEQVFKAYSLSGSQGSGAVRFVPLDRVNTIIAIAPNPASFEEVDKWIKKLDVQVKATAGSVDNYVYRLKYQRAEIIGNVVMQLYGNSNGGYPGGGGFPGGAYPGAGYPGAAGYPGGAYGAGAYGAGAYSGAAYPGGAYAGGGQRYNSPTQLQRPGATPAGAGAGGAAGVASGALSAAGVAPGMDQTGMYLGQGAFQGNQLPRIIPNPFDNTLLVQGSPQDWEQISRLLSQLDVSPRQVLIEAKIYEVDLTGAYTAGVEAYLASKDASISAKGVNLTRQLLGSSTAGGAILTAGMLVGKSRQLLGLLNAEENTTRAKVISAPSVIATDSIQATINVGTDVPTLSSQAVAPGVQQGGTSLFTNTINNRSTGVELSILARVNASGVVTMVIDQSVSAPVPTSSSSIQSPSFSKRNVSTQVTVQDGDTIAIGGIIQESSTQSSSGIPLLHRIPLIGSAFGSKSSNKARTELIVFLTPRVIYDTNQVVEATEELKEKMRGLRHLIRE